MIKKKNIFPGKFIRSEKCYKKDAKKSGIK